jgi:Kef-type K+ transport system membrane component KefB
MPGLDNIFYEFALLLLVAAVFGAIGTLLRQPLIVAFIAVGVAAGPTWLRIIESEEALELLAEMGIALLLFVVGLKLDLHLIRSAGPVALVTGLGQVAFTSGIGFVLCLLLGLSVVHAIFVAVALTFSSTIIIVKLLSDKREIDSLHGRIAVGLLIVQDIVVVLVMIALSAFGTGANDVSIATEALLVVTKGIALLGILGVLMRFVIPPVLGFLARSRELLILSAIAWALALAAVGDMLGFSKEVGAFLAGISLASTAFREPISTRLVTLRDFLLLFFFLTLGASLDLGEFQAQIVPALLLSIFVLVGNPLVVMAIMAVMGYRKRTGFLTGLTVAQISEFSLILGALGLSLGHIDDATMSLITLVGLITIGTSTYLILYSHQIYERLAPWLGIFERRSRNAEAGDVEDDGPVDAIVFGLGRYGNNIVRHLHGGGWHIRAFDFDPQAVTVVQNLGIDARFGDAEDPEFPELLPLSKARLVISSVPILEANLALIHALKHWHYDCRIAVTAHTDAEEEILRDHGAHIILRPYLDAAKEARDILTETLEMSREHAQTT